MYQTTKEKFYKYSKEFEKKLKILKSKEKIKLTTRAYNKNKRITAIKSIYSYQKQNIAIVISIYTKKNDPLHCKTYYYIKS